MAEIKIPQFEFKVVGLDESIKGMIATHQHEINGFISIAIQNVLRDAGEDVMNQMTFQLTDICANAASEYFLKGGGRDMIRESIRTMLRPFAQVVEFDEENKR